MIIAIGDQQSIYASVVYENDQELKWSIRISGFG